MNKKIKSITNLKKICEREKEKGRKIGLCHGCFDILHVGHIVLFQEAKKQCDILIVGLDSDENVKQVKGKPRPVMSEKERAKMLSFLELIDYIFIFKSKNLNDGWYLVYKELGPTVLFTGKNTERFIQDKLNRTQALGIKLVEVQSDIDSTTNIIERVLKNSLRGQ